MFVGDAPGHLEQVLPVFFFGVGLYQHILRRIVHTAQVAGVGGVATAPCAGGGLQQQHAGTCFTRHQRGTQGGIATTDDQNIGVHESLSLQSHSWGIWTVGTQSAFRQRAKAIGVSVFVMAMRETVGRYACLCESICGLNA